MAAIFQGLFKLTERLFPFFQVDRAPVPVFKNREKLSSGPFPFLKIGKKCLQGFSRI